MTYRQTVAAQFAAKPAATPTLEQAKKINADRLKQKQADLIARIKTLIESLNERDCDDWIAALDKAESKNLSARVNGIGAQLHSAFLTTQKA